LARFYTSDVKLSIEDYKKLESRVKLVANRYRGVVDPDDLFQEIMFSFYRKGKPGQTIDQAAIDCLRSMYGRKDTPKCERSRLERNYKQYYDRVYGKVTETDSGDFYRYADLFKGRDRVVMILHFKWGFNNVEIAECFGVSDSRVSQYLKAIVLKLRKVIQFDESRVPHGKAA